MKVIKPNEFSRTDGTFTRASSSTYFDGGVLKTAVFNTPRFQNGILLMEEAATNYCINNNVLPPAYITGDATGTVELISTTFWATTIRLTKTGGTPGALNRVGFRIDCPAIPTPDITVVAWIKKSHAGVTGLGPYVDAARVGGGFTTVAVNLTSATADWNMLSASGTSGGATYSSAAFYVWVDSAVGDFVDVVLPSLYSGSVASSVTICGATPTTRAADRALNQTRASTATYIDGGILKTAAVNEPRFQDGQLLIEKEAVNHAAGSSNFATYWATDGLSTLTPAATAGPSGDVTATRWTQGANRYLYRQLHAEGIPTTGVGAISLFVKADGCTNVRVTLYGPPSQTLKVSDFNLVTGEVTPQVGEAGSLQFLANGWFRLSLVTQDNQTPRLVELFMLESTGGTGLFLDGFQAEAVSVTSYIPTLLTTATRSADVLFQGLIYSTATELYSAWNSGTTYTLNQRVIWNTKIYESLQNSNLNNNPTSSPTFWLDLGSDNRHAALDTKIGSVTSADTELKMIVSSQKLDSLALLNLDASIIGVSVFDLYTSDLIYSNTFGSSGVTVNDWFQYFFFDPLTKRTQAVLSGIGGLSPNTVIALNLKVAAGSQAKLGSLIAGETEQLGATQYAPKVGITDYSKKEADQFGNISVVERPFSKRLSADIYFPNYDLNRIQRFLYSIRATPVVWIASEDPTYEEALVIFGFYKDFSTTIAYPSHSLCSLEIEGLI